MHARAISQAPLLHFHPPRNLSILLAPGSLCLRRILLDSRYPDQKTLPETGARPGANVVHARVTPTKVPTCSARQDPGQLLANAPVTRGKVPTCIGRQAWGTVVYAESSTVGTSLLEWSSLISPAHDRSAGLLHNFPPGYNYVKSAWASFEGAQAQGRSCKYFFPVRVTSSSGFPALK